MDEEERLNLRIDIQHLKTAIDNLQNVLICLTDVEDITDQNYETIHNIREALIDLKMEKEIKYERDD